MGPETNSPTVADSVEAQRLAAEMLVALLPSARSIGMGATQRADVEDALMDLVSRVLAGEASLPSTLIEAIAFRLGEDEVRARLRAYARAVVRNRAIDEGRRAHRRARLHVDHHEPSHEPGPDARIDAQRLLGSLRPDDRTLVVGWLAGHEAFESARAELQLAPATARQRVHRAIEQLRAPIKSP